MFGRGGSKQAEVSATPPAGKPGGKGRPTPSRREAEAAAKARAKVPRTRKEMAAAQRRARADSSRDARAAMRAGDERYYLPRDKGPVRRFVRDFVDSRLSIIELLIPILLVNVVFSFSRVTALVSLGNALLLTALAVMVFDMIRLRRKLTKELAHRFPDQNRKGLTYYAVTRSLQMKFMRLPKPKMKIGQQLPEHYR